MYEVLICGKMNIDLEQVFFWKDARDGEPVI